MDVKEKEEIVYFEARRRHWSTGRCFARLLSMCVLSLIIGLVWTVTCGSCPDASAYEKHSTHEFLTSNHRPPHKSRYVINNKRICTNVQNLTYFIFIFSRVHAFRTREKIRRTWGRQDLFRSIKGRIAFLLGVSDSEKINRKVKAEGHLYGDIIQQDFHDTYGNLSYKGIMASHWISQNCMNARFISKIDDDILVNIFQFVEYLAQNDNLSNHRVFHCHILRRSAPRPMNKSVTHTQVKYEQASDVQIWNNLPFCHGMVWVTSPSIFPDLYKATGVAPFHETEDFYTTGIVRHTVGNIELHGVGFNDIFHYHRNLNAFQDRQYNPMFVRVRHSIYLSSWNLMLCRLKESQRLLANPDLNKDLRPKNCSVPLSSSTFEIPVSVTISLMCIIVLFVSLCVLIGVTLSVRDLILDMEGIYAKTVTNYANV